ncbi:MAG TPA: two-component regulator propeller domain-containing protein, partial [Thermoanaerobaculia bacterium]
MTLRAILVVLLLALHASAAELGEPIFHSVGDLTSIPNGIVADVTQDARGFLWIGTHDGLVRYDGYEFRRYRPDPKDPHSLGENRIRALEAGEDGRVWIANTGGVSIYDPATDRFTRLTKESGLAGGTARTIARGRGGMWVVTVGGLDFVDAKTLRVTHVDAAPPGAPNAVKRIDVGSLLADRRGNLWIGSVAGLAVRRANGTIEDVAPSLAGKAVYRIFETAGGTLWLTLFGGGLHILDPATGSVQEVDPAAKPRAYTMVQPTANEIWTGTPGDGIEVRDARSGALLRRIRHDVAVDETIDSDRVNCLYLDRSGILWIGTWGDGLDRYTPADGAFRLFSYSPSRPEGLTHRDIGSIFQSRDGRLWIGTRGNGVDVFENGVRVDEIRASSDGLADSHVPAIAETADGTIWIGTRAGTLHRYDRRTRRITRHELRSAADTTSTIATLAPAPDGGVWVGLTAGLVYFDPKTSRATQQQFTDGKPLRSSITKLVYDRKGVLWAGTHTTLAARMPGATAFQRIGGTSSDFIEDVLEDRKGRLWIGTSVGLDRLTGFDGKRAKFEQLGARIGRDGLRCENLLEDDRGRIWIDGDVMFDPDTLRFREFTAAEGAGRVIWNGAAAKTRDGQLLYGGPDGVLVIDPALVRDWTYAPPVALTAMRIDGDTRAPGANITLEPRTKSITFEFAALDFSAPERNRYAYRLRGFESDWTEVDASRRSATYTNLPPGNYVFELRGSNRLGVFGKTALAVPLRMRPA